MTWTGAAALNWRQVSLRGDATGLNRDLRSSMEGLMPAGNFGLSRYARLLQQVGDQGSGANRA
jgi:hypothetical protein